MRNPPALPLFLALTGCEGGAWASTVPHASEFAGVLVLDYWGRAVPGVEIEEVDQPGRKAVATTDERGWAYLQTEEAKAVSLLRWKALVDEREVHPGDSVVFVVPSRCLVEVTLDNPEIPSDEPIWGAFDSDVPVFGSSLVVLKGTVGTGLRGYVPCGATSISIEGPSSHAHVRFPSATVRDGWSYRGSLDRGRLVRARVIAGDGTPIYRVSLGEGGYQYSYSDGQGEVVVRIDRRTRHQMRFTGLSISGPFHFEVEQGSDDIDLGSFSLERRARTR